MRCRNCKSEVEEGSVYCRFCGERLLRERRKKSQLPKDIRKLSDAFSYRFDVGMGEVAPFVQADAYWNMISKTWRKKYLDANASAPSYINVPIMAGVSYLYDELWNDITPYAEFGIGADMMFITGEGAGKINGVEYKRFAYKPSTSLSWMLGLGAYFGRHVSAGIYYYGMGTHTIDYTSSTLKNNMLAKTQLDTDRAINAPRQTRSVGSFVLRLGFHF